MVSIGYPVATRYPFEGVLKAWASDTIPTLGPLKDNARRKMKSRSNSGGFTKAGDSLQSLPATAEDAGFDAQDPQLTKSVAQLARAAIRRENGNVVQLPLWYELRRGTPDRAFSDLSLFAAIQGKDRVYLKETVLASTKDVTVKFTGEQLNQDDLTVWDTLVHLAREQPLGTLFRIQRP